MDGDCDNQVDTWYFYRQGRLISVEEDTNKDGRPDLWEAYDKSEALIKRQKDLDFDGKPDVEKLIGKECREE